MEWVLIIGVPLLLLIVWSVKSENKKKAESDARLAAYNASINEARSAIITDTGRASIPVISSSEIRYRPVSGEKVFAVQDGATKMEMRSTGKYRTGGTSVSIPIVKGVRYRVGSGTIRSEKEWQATARGRLILTDKAFVFEGNEKNERITWSQISNAEILADGFRVLKRSGPPKTFVVENPNPKFAATLEIMLNRTE